MGPQFAPALRSCFFSSPRSRNYTTEMSPRRVFVIGVGMTKFEKPGRRADFDYPQMAKESGTKALQDAGITYDKIESVCCGYVYGDTASGQRAVYELGMTGVPVYNVNNACATGSTALYMARNFVLGGLADCVMAMGFEKMEKGALSFKWSDRTFWLDKHMEIMVAGHGMAKGHLTPQMFGNGAREYMAKYGTKPETFGKIAWKNHKHSTKNPYSQFQDEYTLDEIMNSTMMHEPLTKLQCCPTSDGSACAILASEDFVKKHGLEAQAVEIIGMAMGTDTPTTFADKTCISMLGFDMCQRTANKVFKEAGLTRDDVDVVELHDCFSSNELLTYESLGLCGIGEAEAMVEKGDNTYGGKYVINPSGGLLSKGHPLGATGLAQCSELVWQLRGMADQRQVPNAKVALQHNLGLGGAIVVTLYRHGFPEAAKKLQAATMSATEKDFKSAAVFDEVKRSLEKSCLK